MKLFRPYKVVGKSSRKMLSGNVQFFGGLYLSALRAEPATVPFYSRTLQLSILICMFLFKQVCQGALQTIMQKTSSFAIDFLDFAMSKSIKNESKRHQKSHKNRVWGRPGGSRGRLGDHFGPWVAQGSKMGPKSCESLVHFGYQNRNSEQLFVVLFFSVFWLFFLIFFVILGA